MVIELDIISRFRSNLGFDSRIQIIYEYNYIQFIRPGPIPMILPKSFSLLQACCMALFLFISTFASKTIMIVLDTARNLIYKIYLLNFYLHFQSILIVTSESLAQTQLVSFLFGWRQKGCGATILGLLEELWQPTRYTNGPSSSNMLHALRSI